MSSRVFVGVAVAAGLLVTSCGGDDGGGDDGGGDDGGGDGLAEGDEYSVAGALAELPASLDTGDVAITTGDLNAATEAVGFERPDDASDVDAFMEWFNALTMGRQYETARVAYVPPGQVFSPGRLPDVGDFHEELGWSLVDVGSFVESSRPPRLSVVSGPYDDETLSEDLIEMNDGILTNKEGEDQEHDRDDRSGIDPFGRPVRLAQDGDRIASSFETPLVEEWVDGPDETLADGEDLVAVAEALDEAEVFSAYLVRRESGFSSSALIEELDVGSGDAEDSVRERLEEMGLPPSPFGTVGIGWGADDEGAVITVAYQHDNEEAASENADALEEVLTEGSSFDSDRQLSNLYDVVEVGTDATIATVTLRLGPDGWPNTIVDALHTHDFPFIHA